MNRSDLKIHFIFTRNINRRKDFKNNKMQTMQKKKSQKRIIKWFYMKRIIEIFISTFLLLFIRNHKIRKFHI